MPRIIIGVMGAGKLATLEDIDTAYQLGKSIAENGWILLTGGRKAGVMDAASQGAKSAAGIVIGVLPSNDLQGMSDAVDIPIVTEMGNARNNINVLSSTVVIACGMGLGTASEVALALKNNKPVVLLNQTELTYQFFNSLAAGKVFLARDVSKAIALIQQIIIDLK